MSALTPRKVEDSRFVEAFGFIRAKDDPAWLPRIVIKLKGDPHPWLYEARGTFEYAAMCKAKSKGKFFNKWLKGREGGIHLT